MNSSVVFLIPSKQLPTKCSFLPHPLSSLVTKHKNRPCEHLYVESTEKNEMGGACSSYGEEERRIQGFDGGNLRERDHLGDPGVDGRIILRWIFRK